MVEQNNALSAWVDTYTQPMYKWAYNKVSDSEMAKDLVQDTFLAAAEKLSSFKGDSSPKTWLFSILNHKIIDYYRKKVKQPLRMENQSFEIFFTSDGEWKKDKQPGEWSESSENLLDNIDFQAVLKECLDALPEQWSTCVKLKYLLNKKGEEICQEVEISPTNYWQIVHRAKLQLRECVENNWFKN